MLRFSTGRHIHLPFLVQQGRGGGGYATCIAVLLFLPFSLSTEPQSFFIAGPAFFLPTPPPTPPTLPMPSPFTLQFLLSFSPPLPPLPPLLFPFYSSCFLSPRTPLLPTLLPLKLQVLQQKLVPLDFMCKDYVTTMLQHTLQSTSPSLRLLSIFLAAASPQVSCLLIQATF